MKPFDFLLPISHEVSFRSYRHIGDLRITGVADKYECEIYNIYYNGQDITSLMNFLFDEWGLDGFEEHIKNAAHNNVECEEADYTLENQ